MVPRSDPPRDGEPPPPRRHTRAIIEQELDTADRLCHESRHLRRASRAALRVALAARYQRDDGA